MTSRTGANDPPARRRAAFTLVELVLVMLVLATLMAVAAPALSRSLRGHHLDDEANRLLALTEYARDEAASQGIPMVVWIDADGRRFGVDAKPGFGPDGGGDNPRAQAYTLSDDIHFDPVGTGMTPSNPSPSNTGGASLPTTASAPGSIHGGVVAAEFEPDGTLDPASLPTLRLGDRTGDALAVSQTADAYGYEIVKGGQP